MARANFSVNTTRIMAERVAYLCSNPECRTSTIGPNNQPDKSTKIGEAAHITAAASGGPRFDSLLNDAQRSNIDNGLWLCSNCADLIDKDFQNYPVSLLKKWKADAEYEAYSRINGGHSPQKEEKLIPYIEADLDYYSSGRRLIMHSNKNPKEYDEKLQQWVMPIYFDGRTISIWALEWEYSLNLYNNSSAPAFNVRIENVSENRFSQLETVSKINALKPFDVLKLRAVYKIPRTEGTLVEMDELTKSKIAEDLEGMELHIVYYDEARKEHRTIVKIDGMEITNAKL